MRFLSVCSGIEAASVAWLKWKAVGFSEIEPFPSAVLSHHYPDVPNLGDMTRYREWKIGAIDLLVGGTPCQSFSVAGLRKGLEDPRGNLMLVYCGILDWFKPRWFVWENVPGVLSSNGGRDFGAFLGAVAELGYGWAYRVLDAQYFGVAQRRRRVFVVGCLGNWESAAQVLFEPESLSGNPAPRREAGKVAPTIPSRSSAGGGLGTDFDCDGGLIQDVAGTLEASLGRSRGAGTPTAAHSNRGTMVAHAFDARQSGVTQYGDKSGPLDTDGHSVGVAIGTGCYNGQITGDVAATMGTPGSSVNASGPTVMQPVAFAQNQRDEVRVINVAGALAAEPGMKQQTYLAQPAIAWDEELNASVEQAGTLLRGGEGGQHDGVMQPINIYGGNKRADRPEGGFYIRMDEDTSKTLDEGQTPVLAHALRGEGFDASEDGTGQGTPLVPVGFNARQDPISIHPHCIGRAPEAGPQGKEYLLDGSAYCMDSRGQPQAVAFNWNAQAAQLPTNDRDTSVNDGLTCSQQGAVATAMQVRRLTPVECERLQGFPDNYTNIPWRGKPESPDGPRYKALGNSMAVPVMKWIGERIQMVQQ